MRVAAWALVLSLWLPPPVAWSADGADLFARGVAAFKRGDFSDALRHFDGAQAAGLDLPTLHYNRGISLYKLGRYAEAEQAFLASARDPAWVSLGYYNAGLSAYQRGQRAEAARYFKRAWRSAEDNQLAALAYTMLSRADPKALRGPRGTVTASLGYNDNVTLTAGSLTLQTQSESDRFLEILATAEGEWSSEPTALRWDASLYDLRYDQLSDNSLTVLLLGVRKPRSFAAWYTELAAGWDYVLRDGHRLQQVFAVQVEGVRDRANDGDLRVRARASAIDALDDDFVFLDGSRQELEVSAGERVGTGRGRAGVSIERNDRADSVTATDSFSFSPTRYAAWLRASWPLGVSWRFEPFVRYTRGRYPDPERRAGELVGTREDREQQFGIRARYRLAAGWFLNADYSYTDNRSNFEEFSYSQRIISVGAVQHF